MRTIDFSKYVREAWRAYGSDQEIRDIFDVSPMVSTNHVFKLFLDDGTILFAKLSYYGRFEHFKEDHAIINALEKKLPPPYENFLAVSLTKEEELYIYRFSDQRALLEAWVVFYEPVQIGEKLPRRLEKEHIRHLGRELALFHQVCHQISPELPPSSKTMRHDMEDLLGRLDTEEGQFEYGMHKEVIREQVHIFLENYQDILKKVSFSYPVFVDWNIGNFSVSQAGRFFSRWDYDWFRVSSRVMDFYFFSRVVSAEGDRTIFSYLVNPLMQERFQLFLQEYHQVYPLKPEELYFIREAYRFFILNYVVKDGRYFFHEIYANRLRKEAYEMHLPVLKEDFQVEVLLRALRL